MIGPAGFMAGPKSDKEVIEVERLHKVHFKALERIFAAEVQGRLPLQSKAAVFKELEIMGYAKQGSELWGAVTVSGWFLTQAGRLTYCMNCDDKEAVTP